MIRKVLVANRGEIAYRIIKTLKKIGVQSVAVYDERENRAMYVSCADEAFSLGSGPLARTFLDQDKILEICRKSGADAVHPGYGFLSESAVFARKLTDSGIVFIGPSPDSLELMGNKVNALKLASRAGLPLLPSFHFTNGKLTENIRTEDFPVIIKPVLGGGGKAMYIAKNHQELNEFTQKTALESSRYFGHNGFLVEKYLTGTRHIEVQILGDRFGNLIHLFERECTIQRRFQKIIEEAPSTGMKAKTIASILSDAVKIGKEAGYYNAGTVEFLVDRSGNHYFMEVNPRIQVEHPVTECITGIDIVAEQIAIAEGKPLPAYLQHLKPSGHAIEARIYAEDVLSDFNPSSGRISLVEFPDDKHIRVEHSLKSRDEVLPDFDPLLAKVITFGKSREEAISYMRSALDKTSIHGIRQNINFLSSIFRNKRYIKGLISTDFIKEQFENLHLQIEDEQKLCMATAGLYLSLFHLPRKPLAGHKLSDNKYWRIYNRISCHLNSEKFIFYPEEFNEGKLILFWNDRQIMFECRMVSDCSITFKDHNNQITQLLYSWDDSDPLLYLGSGPYIFNFGRDDFLYNKNFERRMISKETVQDGIMTAPLSGKIIKLNVSENDSSEMGRPLLTIESMKMENEILMPFRGKVMKIHVSKGDQVREGDLLAEVVSD